GVRLRLGLVVERDGKLGTYRPAFSERSLQGLLHELRCGRVRGVLRLLDNQLAADELDRLVLVEDAERNQPVVFRPCPALCSERRLSRGHVRSLPAGITGVNVYHTGDARVLTPSSRLEHYRCCRGRATREERHQELALDARVPRRGR